ncbi:MAG: purine-cytosine permease family protein [Thermomicrobiales bacterium]
MDTVAGYQETILTIEPHGIEPIAATERHGHVRSLFTLWFAANMGLPVWLVGALAVVFGLGFKDGVFAILLGNLIGCGLLALTTTMAPTIGMPQLPFTRRSFGRRGVYLPALLNWVSTCGWYAVNSILGGLALARLTHLPFGIALALLSITQVLVGIYGYNFIHQFEAITAVMLAAIFAAMTVIGLPKAHLGLESALPTGKHLGLFILMTTAVASYVFSWSPYAADYARYLPTATSKRAIFAAVFGGAFISCVWLQVLGAAVATIGLILAPIDLVVHVMGGFWIPALVAVVIGTIAANALNIYTGALALLTLDVPVKRWISVLAVGVLGGALAAYGSRGLSSKYENFLLLVSYWIGPWLGIVLVDFFLRRARGTSWSASRQGFRWAGIGAFLVGLVISIPFMNSTLYTGTLARRFGGADIAYYIGMGVAAAVYYIFSRASAMRAEALPAS